MALHNFDKAVLLKERHINVSIEWGGTEYFTNSSDMSIEGVVEFLRIMAFDDKKMMDELLTALIQSEYEKD